MIYKQKKTSHPEVLFLCQLFYPELISTGQSSTELCELLTKLGIKVKVICGPPTIVDRKTRIPKRMNYKGIDIFRVSATRFSKLSFLGKFINQLSYALSVFFHLLLDFSKKPILVVTNPPFLGAICALLNKIGGKPYIYVIYDVYPDTAINLGVLSKNSIISLVWEWWNRFIIKHADSIIVLGRCTKKVILNKGNGINGLSNKIHIAPVWSDDRIIKPLEKNKNPFIEKWSLTNKFVLSYSGNMGRFHDMRTIMEAAKELNKKYKDILFLFVGEGYKKNWIIEYANKFKLTNCQFHSYVDRKDLGKSLACADVGLVSLSPGQEGLSVPSKAIGIMAAGVPVIGIMSKKSEMALILKENNCGFVVEPGESDDLIDSILKLYHHEALRKELGRNALEAVKNKYNLRNAALKYGSIIKSLQY